MRQQRLLAVARGDEPADLVLRNLRLVDVLNHDCYTGTIAICDGHIAAIGVECAALEEHDLQGALVCPGLIDAHVHLESSMLHPIEYARAVVARGVTTVIANPHEIANVLGLQGIRYLLQAGKDAPLDILMTVPSSVPATELATSGARLGREDLLQLKGCRQVVGLGEVMDFPGVVAGKERLLQEIALFRGGLIDGHCPTLAGRQLQAYAAAGISSDHESSTVAEAFARLRCGMKLFLREGSAARNLLDLLPLLNPHNERWICLCTDDLHPADLLHKGSIDHLLRLAVAAGVSPLSALRLATLNPAEHYRLQDRGLIAPGRRADLLVVDSLTEFRPRAVYCQGRLVSINGRLPELPGNRERAEGRPPNTVRLDVQRLDFRIPAQGHRLRVIEMVPGQLLTRCRLLPARIVDGFATADPPRDVLKIAVVERHHGSGRCGLGFVCGLGLRAGALASTVAHDHHNLLVVGADDRSMLTAARAVANAGGGQAVALGDELLALLPLPIAGLLAEGTIEQVAAVQHSLTVAARRLGCSLTDPFMALSFLGLEVIPELKLTDLGLVQVSTMELVPLFVEDE